LVRAARPRGRAAAERRAGAARRLLVSSRPRAPRALHRPRQGRPPGEPRAPRLPLQAHLLPHLLVQLPLPDLQHLEDGAARRDHQRPHPRHRGRLAAPARDLQGTACPARRRRGPRHDALRRQRGPLPGRLCGCPARSSRPPPRRVPRQHRARVTALPRQHRPGPRREGRQREACGRGRGVRAPARAPPLAGRLPRARVPVEGPPLSRDRPHADALPRAQRVVLRRLVGQRLPVHDLRPQDREPQGRGLRPGAALEHARGRPAGARDLRLPLPAVLDAVRGVPEHHGELRDPRAAAGRVRGARGALAATLFFAAATPWVLRPWFTARDALPRAEGPMGGMLDADLSLNVWILGWTAHAILTDPAHLFDGNIYYPAPNTIAGSENMLAHLPVTVPALAATGNVLVALKAMALESFVLAGLAMFLLVHHHTRDAGAALLAGAAYTFAPWRVHTLPQPQYLGAQYLPLALLAVDCWLERRRVRALAGLAAALALQALACLYLGYFAFVAVPVYALVRLARAPAEKARAAAGLAAGFAAGALV